MAEGGGEHNRITYVVVSKHQPFLDCLLGFVTVNHMLSILYGHGEELFPRHTTHVAVCLPRVDDGITLGRGSRHGLQLPIKICDNLCYIIQPLIPILPNGRAPFTLARKEFNAIVKLAHSLGNLLGSVNFTQMGGRQRDGVEKLLKTTILKGA